MYVLPLERHPVVRIESVPVIEVSLVFPVKVASVSPHCTPVSEILKCSEGAVKAKVFRAIQALKKKYEELEILAQ